MATWGLIWKLTTILNSCLMGVLTPSSKSPMHGWVEMGTQKLGKEQWVTYKHRRQTRKFLGAEIAPSKSIHSAWLCGRKGRWKLSTLASSVTGSRIRSRCTATSHNSLRWGTCQENNGWVAQACRLSELTQHQPRWQLWWGSFWSPSTDWLFPYKWIPSRQWLLLSFLLSP